MLANFFELNVMKRQHTIVGDDSTALFPGWPTIRVCVGCVPVECANPYVIMRLFSPIGVAGAENDVELQTDKAQ